MLHHYTDEVGKSAIMRTGYLLPGIDGRLYLTAESISSAAEAQARLALSRRPSGYFEISELLVNDIGHPDPVPPKYGQPGGGQEQFVTRAIAATELSWIELPQ
ncbi:MAG: hypothetical protein ACR2FO_04110 [Actinomycetota bacterium]